MASSRTFPVPSCTRRQAHDKLRLTQMHSTCEDVSARKARCNQSPSGCLSNEGNPAYHASDPMTMRLRYHSEKAAAKDALSRCVTGFAETTSRKPANTRALTCILGHPQCNSRRQAREGWLVLAPISHQRETNKGRTLRECALNRHRANE